MALTVVPLHQHPEYTMQCCRLINDEWKRSDTARLHSLQSSCDTLPTSLILLHDKSLIGHLKLTPIPSIKEAVFVESVVIDKKLRGKGYGSVLMNEAEKHCKEVLKKDMVYLSTKGQEGFYKKLGYEECAPVSIYGGSCAPKTEAKQNIVKVENSSSKNAPIPPPMPTGNGLMVKCGKTFMKKII